MMLKVGVYLNFLKFLDLIIQYMRFLANYIKTLSQFYISVQELLKDVKVNIDGFTYDVSLNVIGGSAKSTTTTDVKRIES